MKKKLILLFAIVCSLASYSAGVVLKYGSSGNPIVQVDDKKGQVYDRTHNLTIEALGALNDSLDIGAGIEFGTRFKKDGNKSNIGYVPLYLTVKNKLGEADSNSFPYLIGRFGFTLPLDYDKNDSVTPNGGLHLGIGAGLEINHLVLEITGTHSNVRTEDDSILKDEKLIGFNKLTFSIGYRFGLGSDGDSSSTPAKKKSTPVKEEPVVEKKVTPAKKTTPTETKTVETKTETVENNEIYNDLLNPKGEEELSREKYIETRIKELDEMKRQGIITEEEYNAEKEIIMSEI